MIANRKASKEMALSNIHHEFNTLPFVLPHTYDLIIHRDIDRGHCPSDNDSFSAMSLLSIVNEYMNSEHLARLAFGAANFYC